MNGLIDDDDSGCNNYVTKSQNNNKIEKENLTWFCMVYVPRLFEQTFP